MRPERKIPARLLADARAQEGLVDKAQCDAVGLDKYAVGRLIRTGRWARAARCVYDTAPDPVERRRRDDYYDHVRRRAAWTGMLAVPDGIATGACALALYRVAGLPARLVPEVARPGGKDAAVGPAVVLRRYRSFPTVRYRGRSIASLASALVQGLPGLTRGERVAVLSSVLHKELLDTAALDTVAGMMRRRRGSVQALTAFPLVSALDESPAETAARLSCLDHGVPPDGQQVTFLLGDVFLARVDLAWRLPGGRYLVVEIDGRAFHTGRVMLADDSLRQNALTGTGRLIVLRYPAAQALVGGIGKDVAARLAGLSWTRGAPLPPSVDLAE
ncbi:hypothetical protein ACO229_15990 [Promicromonospora sp. MS192]|uniref:hypothetical protein n=1 Tax=Promicromonospora sp. MS192 TaxID=3412684 RepID=UPI003C2D6ACE